VAQIHDSMINPRIENLLSKVDSKFTLVSLASMRARQINSYFGQLGDGTGNNVPPQVTSVARKPLSIAFEEIAADKIVPVRQRGRGDRRRPRAWSRPTTPSDPGRRRQHPAS
jgi:DNA-directed RNA polymerase subunit omega